MDRRCSDAALCQLLRASAMGRTAHFCAKWSWLGARPAGAASRWRRSCAPHRDSRTRTSCRRSAHPRQSSRAGFPSGDRTTRVAPEVASATCRQGSLTILSRSSSWRLRRSSSSLALTPIERAACVSRNTKSILYPRCEPPLTLAESSSPEASLARLLDHTPHLASVERAQGRRPDVPLPGNREQGSRRGLVVWCLNDPDEVVRPNSPVDVFERDAALAHGLLRRLVSINGVLEVLHPLIRPVDQGDIAGHCSSLRR